jgi:hypothetical protein
MNLVNFPPIFKYLNGNSHSGKSGIARKNRNPDFPGKILIYMLFCSDFASVGSA